MWRIPLKPSCLLALCISWMAFDQAHGQITLSSSTRPHYVNRVYHFRVAIPTGVTYTRTIPPSPDHGFAVDLPDRIKLWTDASYTDAGSAREEVDKQTADCRVNEEKPALLGGMAAVATRFTCPANTYHEAYEERLVLTVHHGAGTAPICYQVALRAVPEKITPAANELFQQIAASFRHTISPSQNR